MFDERARATKKRRLDHKIQVTEQIRLGVR